MQYTSNLVLTIRTPATAGGVYQCTPTGPLISVDDGFGRVPVLLVDAD